jgi:hypothetical protein
VCNITERKSSLEEEKNKEITKRNAHGTRTSPLKCKQMKSLTTKLACLFILASCMQVLTASTASTCATPKSQPVETKQVKPKKSSKGKSHMPLYKSLLNHF